MVADYCGKNADDLYFCRTPLGIQALPNLPNMDLDEIGICWYMKESAVEALCICLSR
jgi:hypothetical protein